jgi:long-chain acyl-CoA synthetase
MTDLDFKGLSIPESFDRTAARYPDKTAVVYLGTNFSYKRIRELSDRFAAGLKARGFPRASGRVVMYLPNSIQWVIAWLGVLKAGGTAAPITPIYTPFDLEYIAVDTEAEAVVCSDRNYGYVTRVLPNTGLKLVIVSNMADILPAYKRFFGWAFDRVPRGKVGRADHTFLFPQFLREAPSSTSKTTVDPKGAAQILYTGGTTKHPKGVPIPHEMVLACAHEQISVSSALFPLDQNVIMGSAPMFHILGQTTFLGAILLHGGTIVIQPRVNIDALLDAVQHYRARTMIGVPSLFRMIIEHDRLDQYNISSLVYSFSGGDVLPQDLADRWKERFGKPIYNGYGASETVGGVAMSRPGDDIPAGSMGRVLKSKNILLMGADMEPVEPGQPGEIWVHSDPMVYEYWKKPEETAAAFIEVDGKKYYRTADVVRMDENGYLFFVDRTVDTIKHKGYRVSASEIESVLQDHAAVVAACVIGIPDEKVGERIKAFVVLKKDVKGITGYDLITFCRKRLVNYKVPHYVEFRDMLPKSKVGKMLRREIRAEERRRVQ